MKVSTLIGSFAVICSTVSFADEVDSLRDLARTSEDHRELVVDCLIEMKIGKRAGWDSEQCAEYRRFSSADLGVFKQQIASATQAFKLYSKSDVASKRRIKRGLKQLVLIQQNMESIGKLSKEIKNESKK